MGLRVIPPPQSNFLPALVLTGVQTLVRGVRDPNTRPTAELYGLYLAECAPHGTAALSEGPQTQ